MAKHRNASDSVYFVTMHRKFDYALERVSEAIREDGIGKKPSLRSELYLRQKGWVEAEGGAQQGGRELASWTR